MGFTTERHGEHGEEILFDRIYGMNRINMVRGRINLLIL
jgi:hypothetical protein